METLDQELSRRVVLSDLLYEEEDRHEVNHGLPLDFNEHTIDTFFDRMEY